MSIAPIVLNSKSFYTIKEKPNRLSLNQSRTDVQTINCYDFNNSGGTRLRSTDYIPDLRQHDFDNKIGSCCLTGIWILYAEDEYNSYNTGAANWWAYGDNFCADMPVQFDNQASSLRFTGAPDDWNYDTLNIYFNNYFTGDEEFTYEDNPQLNYNDRAKSLIVTGCTPWTLYDGDHFTGESMCVFPNSASECTPGFYPMERALGSLAGRVSSAKKGCHARLKVLPVNHNKGTATSGSSQLYRA